MQPVTSEDEKSPLSANQDGEVSPRTGHFVFEGIFTVYPGPRRINIQSTKAFPTRVHSFIIRLRRQNKVESLGPRQMLAIALGAILAFTFVKGASCRSHDGVVILEAFPLAYLVRPRCLLQSEEFAVAVHLFRSGRRVGMSEAGRYQTLIYAEPLGAVGFSFPTFGDVVVIAIQRNPNEGKQSFVMISVLVVFSPSTFLKRQPNILLVTILLRIFPRLQGEGLPFFYLRRVYPQQANSRPILQREGVAIVDALATVFPRRIWKRWIDRRKVRLKDGVCVTIVAAVGCGVFLFQAFLGLLGFFVVTRLSIEEVVDGTVRCREALFPY